MTMRGVAPPSVTMAHIFVAVVPYVVMSLILLAAVFWVPAVPPGCRNGLVDTSTP
jgi:TRAP-type mannitol/chloroaromatic compound transport system permease large subunit